MPLKDNWQPGDAGLSGAVNSIAATLNTLEGGGGSGGTPTDGSVSTAKLAAGAVTTAKLADDSVTSAKIAAFTIVDGDVNANAAIAQSKISNLTTDLGAKAPLASPALTGNPTAPTQTAGNNSTRIATTAFVTAAVAAGGGGGGDTTGLAPLASPVFTGNPTAPTPTSGDNDTTIANTAYVQGEIANRSIIIRWNSVTDTWPPRPAGAPFGVRFISTNDPAATAPTDVNLAAGDLWERHPNAV